MDNPIFFLLVWAITITTLSVVIAIVKDLTHNLSEFLIVLWMIALAWIILGLTIALASG